MAPSIVKLHHIICHFLFVLIADVAHCECPLLFKVQVQNAHTQNQNQNGDKGKDSHLCIIANIAQVLSLVRKQIACVTQRDYQLMRLPLCVTRCGYSKRDRSFPHSGVTDILPANILTIQRFCIAVGGGMQRLPLLSNVIFCANIIKPALQKLFIGFFT